MYTQNSPSSFQWISPCLPKHNPELECKFSPPASTPHLAVATSGRCQGKRPQVDVNQVLLNEFSLWQRSGCKTVARNAGPPKNFFFYKKETMNLVFVVTYVASPPFPTFFLLLKPAHAKEKQFFTLHCVLYFMKWLPYRKPLWTSNINH